MRTPGTLNLYGDHALPTSGGHGSNISVQRLDDLDVASLHFALDSQPDDGAFVDLGCGLGAQGLRFAALGKSVWLYDLADIEPRIETSRQLLMREDLRFTLCDLAVASADIFPDRIRGLYSQRFVNFIRYDAALRLFRLLRERMTPEGRVFLSAGGLNSPFGHDYPDRARPLPERFCPVAPDVAAQQNAHVPMCLYDENDLHRLLTESGFCPHRVYTSSFGNVKAEAGV